VGVALAGDDQSLQKSVQIVRAAKAAGLESEPACRIEQRPGRRIGEHHPRGAIYQHHAPGQALKPVRRRVLVEIAQPKFTMDTNGAVDVRQRGLEDKLLLAGYFIFPGLIGNGDHCRNLVPDQQTGTHRRNPELGRAHPLIEEGGSDEVLSRDQAIEQEYLAGWPRDRAGPKRIMEGPIFLEDRVHDRIGTRRDRIIYTGATVQAEQADLRRPHGVGKSRQRFSARECRRARPRRSNLSRPEGHLPWSWQRSRPQNCLQ